MIRYRYNPNATGIPEIETAGVHGALFTLEMNSDYETGIGELEDDMIEPELLEQFVRYGYITIIPKSDEDLLLEAFNHFETALRAIRRLESVYAKAVFDAPIDRMFERLNNYITGGEMFHRVPVNQILKETLEDMQASLKEHRRRMSGKDND